jgi:hypothetical protein
MKRYYSVNCKFNDGELKLLNTLVMQSGCSSRSEFIRQRIFQKKGTDISNKELLEKNLDMGKKLLAMESLILKNQQEIYVTQRLVSACLQELARKEFPRYKEMVSEFINRVRAEAPKAVNS